LSSVVFSHIVLTIPISAPLDIATPAVAQEVVERNKAQQYNVVWTTDDYLSI